MGKKIAALLTILAIIFTVTICTPDSNAGIQTLNLSKQTKEIKVGESFQLTMTGVKASSIKWKSSKPGVATVSKKGVVKGIKAGTTNITGKYKSLKFTIKVVVKKKQDKTTSTTTESTTEGTTSTSTQETTEAPTPKPPTKNLDGLSVKYKSSGFAIKDDERLWAITYTFSNKNRLGTCFYSKYYNTVYINGVEQSYVSVDNDLTNVINGASVDVTFYYRVKSGDTVYAVVTSFDDNHDKIIILEVPDTIIK